MQNRIFDTTELLEFCKSHGLECKPWDGKNDAVNVCGFLWGLKLSLVFDLKCYTPSGLLWELRYRFNRANRRASEMVFGDLPRLGSGVYGDNVTRMAQPSAHGAANGA